MPIKRICIETGCGKLFDLDSTGTQRCPACQPAADQRRNARPSSSKRGLGWDWTKAKQQDAGYQAATHCQCAGCGYCGSHGCGQPFTPGNPKTGEHAVPRSRGGTRTPASIPALCLRCNSSKGGALRKGAPYTTSSEASETDDIDYDNLPFA